MTHQQWWPRRPCQHLPGEERDWDLTENCSKNRQPCRVVFSSCFFPILWLFPHTCSSSMSLKNNIISALHNCSPKYPPALWEDLSSGMASRAWQASAAARSLIVLTSSSSAHLSGSQNISPPRRQTVAWGHNNPNLELVVACSLAAGDFVCCCYRGFWPSLCSMLFAFLTFFCHMNV